jgi:hypothetical protein
MHRSASPDATGMDARGTVAILRALAILMVAWLATAWAEGKPDAPTRESAGVGSTWELSVARLPTEAQHMGGDGGSPSPTPQGAQPRDEGTPDTRTPAPDLHRATPFLERVSYSPTGPPAVSASAASPGSPLPFLERASS